MNDDTPATRAERIAGALAWLVAGGYAAYGLFAMVLLSPRVPYADSWRYLARFLTTPFPASVVEADNGHRELLGHTLRLCELEYFAANQWLQIGAGVGQAVLVFGLGLGLLRSLPAPRRGFAAAALAAGLFWLGNGRKLAHGSESLSQFLVLLLLLLGLRAIAGGDREAMGRRIGFATACGVLASFSFGSGLACFPAFVVVLLLRGTSWRQLAPFAIAAMFVIACLLAGSQHERAQLAILERLDLWLRWLGSGSVWAFSPWLDPEHAARLPGEWMHALTCPIAGFLHDSFGPRLVARWPAFAFGLCGLGWLAAATWRARRRPAGDGAASYLERIALGLAWFGAGVGALVVGLRVDYFREHPDQVTTQRYVPWAMLMWTGLLLVAVVRARTTVRAAWPVATFVLLLLPSTIWTTRLAWKQRAIAELTAAGAAVGVLGQDFDLVETDEADLRRALPLLRERGAAMFAWPEVGWLGRPWPGDANTAKLADVEVRAVQNRFAGDGCQVSFHADAGAGRLLLFGVDRTVVGLALRWRGDDQWHGWLRGNVAAGDLRAGALR